MVIVPGERHHVLFLVSRLTAREYFDETIENIGQK
jgi:hypothetical protein